MVNSLLGTYCIGYATKDPDLKQACETNIKEVSMRYAMRFKLLDDARKVWFNKDGCQNSKKKNGGLTNEHTKNDESVGSLRARRLQV